MQILLDTANLPEIRECLTYFPIAGFTTNPSILARDSDDLHATLSELRKLAGKSRMMHVQVTAESSMEMVEQAKLLKEALGANFYAKIPMTLEGLRAVDMCRALDIHVTVTAVFTPLQALLAAKAGADYVAPYVDRLDNIISDGSNVVGEILNLMRIYDLDTKVLAASFKNVQQVYNVASIGVQAVTIAPALCEKLVFHPFTDKSLADFKSDWTGKFGKSQISDYVR